MMLCIHMLQIEKPNKVTNYTPAVQVSAKPRLL